MVFTNKHWMNEVLYLTSSSFYLVKDDDHREVLCANYKLNPLEDHVASTNKLVFDPKKAAAIYFWYKSADREDASIIDFFEEYERCIDENHRWFNSNYGIYAYKLNGLQRCINVLIKDKDSRQACFCINNNSAMSESSIDKLCTNTIQFFIRDDKLIMLVQMRSSNILTLLPYDFFIFSVWYALVFNKLKAIYPNLVINKINVQVASLHYYRSDFYIKDADDAPSTGVTRIFNFSDMCNSDFENILEEKLINFLNK